MQFGVRFCVRSAVAQKLGMHQIACTKSHSKLHAKSLATCNWEQFRVGHQIADAANHICDMQQIAHEIAHEIARVPSPSPISPQIAPC
jgi:hypothetical protein